MHGGLQRGTLPLLPAAWEGPRRAQQRRPVADSRVALLPRPFCRLQRRRAARRPIQYGGRSWRWRRRGTMRWWYWRRRGRQAAALHPRQGGTRCTPSCLPSPCACSRAASRSLSLALGKARRRRTFCVTVQPPCRSEGCSPGAQAAALAGTATRQSRCCLSCACRLPVQALVQVYDLQNKVVAASAPLEQPLAWLLPHAGGACIDVGAPLLASRSSPPLQ